MGEFNFASNKRKASNKSSNHQMDILVDFMERHQEFARDYSMNSPELWQVLVTLLSSAEGVTQSEKSWKKMWTDLIASTRQNMSFMLNGLRDTPNSNNHMRVLQLVGEEDFQNNNSGSSKKAKFVDLSESPSTSSGIYHVPLTQATRTPLAAGGFTMQSRMSPSTIRPITLQNPMMSRQPPAMTSNFVNRNLSQLSQARPRSTTTQSEQLLKTFEEKGSVLVETLVTQITSCFDKYTDVIKQCLENQTRQICDIIAQQVQVPVTEENQDNVVEEQTIPDCPICQEHCTEAVQLIPCQHKFCEDCIRTWLRSEHSCPLCRTSIETNPLLWDDSSLTFKKL